MALIHKIETYVLNTIFNKELISMALSKKGNVLFTRFTVNADKIINKVKSVKQKRIIWWIVKNFEKNIEPNDCGDANTCFQVLFLYSICGIKLQTRMINMGNKNAAKDCHPLKK